MPSFFLVEKIVPSWSLAHCYWLLPTVTTGSATGALTPATASNST